MIYIAFMDIAFLLNQTPEEIVKYFESKGYALSWNWYDTWQKYHTRAFTVAKVMRLDILQDIRQEVQDAIKNGTTFEQFQKNLIPVLQKKGWWGRKWIGDGEGGAQEVQLGSVRRLRLIYEINLRVSYNAGRYQSMIDNVSYRPYWMYINALLPNSRETHKALHRKVFRYDDPFWDTMYPPNDWNCKCRVRALSDNDMKEMGLEVSKGSMIDKDMTLPDGSKATVTGYKDPSGKTTFPGAGWSYNPGKEAFTPDLSQYDPDLLSEYQKLKDDYQVRQLEKIKEILGTNTKTYVTNLDGESVHAKPGVQVEAYAGYPSKIKKVYKDLLGNENYVTEFHLDEHIKKHYYRSLIEKLLKNPDIILLDTEKRAILYYGYDKKSGLYFFVTSGQDSNQIYTMTERKGMLENMDRYRIIYRKIT